MSNQYGSCEDGCEDNKVHDAKAAHHTQDFLVNVYMPEKSGTMAVHENLQMSEVIAGGIFSPILIFLAVTWLNSTELRYYAPGFAKLGSCMVILLIFASCGRPAYKMEAPRRKRLYYYMLASSLVAWTFGTVAGNMNYQRYFKNYFDLTSLVIKYPNVNTATYHGQQFLDAGVMEFEKGTYVDVEAGFGFKNGDTYCVAPIVSPLAKVHGFQNFDFWAVGVNCCSAHQPQFACGEYNNPKASKGLRLLNDDLRNYFRLAVEGACAANSITAKYPIFFYWMENPEQEVDAMVATGWGYFGRETMAYLVFQICITVLMVIAVL